MNSNFTYYQARCSAEEQAQVISQLRQSKRGKGLKVLVSTDVAEEGLDIPECNVVVSYNEVMTLTQFIQVQGRARSANSEFAILMRLGRE